MSTLMRNIVLLRLVFVMANVLGPFSALFFQRHYLLESPKVALVITLMSAFYLLGNLMGGFLVGRYSFKTLLVCVSFCSFVVLLVSVLMSSTFFSIVMILLFMFCAGLITPVFSVLTSIAADDSNRVASFGYLHLASNLGAALLFVVGGYLLDFDSLYLVFFAMVMSALCLLLSSYLKLPERKFSFSPGIAFPIKAVRSIPRLVIIAGAIFFALAVLDAQREYQLPLWLDIVTAGQAATLYGAVGIVNALLVIVLTQPLIVLTSRFRPITNLSLAAIFYGVGFGAYAIFEQSELILSFVFFWTLGEILGITYITALISQKVPIQMQAALFSLIPVLLAGGRILSVGMAAYMINAIGFYLSWFLYGAFGILFGGICLLVAHLANALTKTTSLDTN